MQNFGTIRIQIERSIDRVHLTSNASNSIKQLLLFFCGVSHKKFQLDLDKDTPPGILWARFWFSNQIILEQRGQFVSLTALTRLSLRPNFSRMVSDAIESR